MDSWIPLAIIIVIVLFIIGNFSTVHKNARTPLRKKSLNDLEETLPRTQKSSENKPTFGKK